MADGTYTDSILTILFGIQSLLVAALCFIVMWITRRWVREETEALIRLKRAEQIASLARHGSETARVAGIKALQQEDQGLTLKSLVPGQEPEEPETRTTAAPEPPAFRQTTAF